MAAERPLLVADEMLDRIKQQVAEVSGDSAVSGISLGLLSDDPPLVRCELEGPPGSPYEAGIFTVYISFGGRAKHVA